MPTSTSDAEDLKQRIRAMASDLGFDAFGVCGPDDIAPFAARLQAFIDDGWHGDMDWLADRASQRKSPKALWRETQSVIAVAMNYGPTDNPLGRLDDRGLGNVSVYAQGRDYHDVVKKRLKALARWLHTETGAALKVFVDTAPVAEKPLAMAAGLGWTGKHTNLVSRDFGSWLFLGVIYLEIPLPPDQMHEDNCGGCQRCLEICPTQAMPRPYQLDARRCISYLTIEHKGHIDREFRAAIGNRIFGCDDCLAVCPWNKFAVRARQTALWPKEQLTGPRLSSLLALDDAGFRQMTSRTPVKRLGRIRFIRNALIAAGNSGDENLAEPVTALLDDRSPLIRAMAVWALSRLLAAADFAVLRRDRAVQEEDEAVAAEWHAG
jgi:epoxyqueuosine reductase